MRHTLSLCLTLSAATLWAQPTWRVDSLLTTWPVRLAVEEDRHHSTPGVIRAVDEQGIDLKLERTWPGMPVFTDTLVRRYVALYGEPRREEFRAMLGAARAYFPLFESELVRQGLPKEWKYLPMALSAMNVTAASSEGQAGPWMLTYPDAVRHGLRVTAEVDERRDPRTSTMAAVALLKELLKRYPNREHALAAFACGPANLERAKGRAGVDAPLKELYPHFSKGSREVLPLLMAFTFLATHAHELGISPLEVQPMEEADTLRYHSDIRVNSLLTTLNLPGARFRALNPTLCGSMVPAHLRFLLPRGEGTRFLSLSDSIARIPVTQVPPRTNSATGTSDADGREAIEYRVRPGDYLGRIAARFGVKVSQIKTWNKLRSDRISTGDKLIIHLPASQRARYERLHAKDGDTEPTNHLTPSPPPAATSPTPAYTWYTVRSGDSLYGIARRYPGLDADTLMRVNGITANIRPGQKLKIPVER